MTDEPIDPPFEAKLLTFPKRPSRTLQVATPPAPEPEAGAPVIDQAFVAALEAALEGARAGAYSGFAILTMKTNGAFMRWLGLPSASTFEEQQLRGFAMNGAMALLVKDMEYLALQKYPSVQDAIEDAKLEDEFGEDL